MSVVGYGGDGNASCKSFQTLYEGSSVYMNWMQMWQDCIREDGGMPHCVPNPYPAEVVRIGVALLSRDRGRLFELWG